MVRRNFRSPQNFGYGGDLQNPHRAAHGGGPVLWYTPPFIPRTSLVNFESVYHLYNDVYPHFLKNVPVPMDGCVTAPETPGQRIEIREEAFCSGDAVIETVAE